MGFWKPKKDACAKCAKWKHNPEDAGKLEDHLKQKSECRAAKEATKKKARANESVVMSTMDLESVLQLPHSNVSTFYYTRKLCVYNFTICDGPS
ncbi:MAG: hypothetical protein GY696_29640, partial [Gammaproteobacteria bacterium]|nr:hypothetical protein [Gammaproteobacteria bacterium]